MNRWHPLLPPNPAVIDVHVTDIILSYKRDGCQMRVWWMNCFLFKVLAATTIGVYQYLPYVRLVAKARYNKPYGRKFNCFVPNIT